MKLKSLRKSLSGKPALILPVAGFVLLLGAGASGSDENYQEIDRLIKSGEILSSKDIVKKSKQLYPGGRVTETDLDKEWGGYVYEVEIIDRDGAEWDVEFSAKTGEVIEKERED